MSLQDEVGGPQDGLCEKKNNNKQPLHPAVGDANANRILMEKSHTDSPVPPLLSHSGAQERIIIWGTHARSEDPELEEFELLECQELEAFLKDGTQGDFHSHKERDKKDFLQRRSSLVSSGTGNSLRTDQNANHSRDMDVDQTAQPLDLRTSVSRSGQRKSLRESRSGSENNVFISTLSAVSSLSGSLASALDSAGRRQPPSSLPSKPTSDMCRIQQQATQQSLIFIPKRSREQPRDVDQNHNSTTLPQEPCKLSAKNGDFPADQQGRSVDKEQIRQETSLSSKFQRNLERVPPSRRQLVRPLSPETEQRLTSGHLGYTEGMREQRTSRFSDQTCPKVSSYQIGPKESAEISSNAQSLSSGSGVQTTSQTCAKSGSILRRQGSAEHAASPLDRKSHFNRRAYSSPTRPSTPPSPKTTGSPQRRAPMSPVRTRVPARAPQLGYGASQGYSSGLRPPVKTNINMNVQNTVPQQGSTETSPPKCPPKPKSVRPKIITYIRKSPQPKPQAPDGPYDVSSLPTRLLACSPARNSKLATTAEPDTAPVLSASNLLYDKYRQELQKARLLSPGLMVSGIKPPSHTMPPKATGKTHSFYGSLSNKYPPTGIGRSPTILGPQACGIEDPPENQIVTQETATIFRPPRTIRPQLGVGAVNRAPSTTVKTRIFTGQKSPLALNQPVQAVTPSVTSAAILSATSSVTSSVTPSTHSPPESLDQRKAATAVSGLSVKSFLPKPAQSGLRPPGYSRLPPARLAAFGFVRSSSVSSVSSNHSTDSSRSDPCRPAYRPEQPAISGPIHLPTTASQSTPGVTQKILNAILPPRVWYENNQCWVQQVSSAPCGSRDVVHLQDQLDFRLQQWQAKETGLCPVRRELYTQFFDELIRQVTINCAERGLLLLQVRDESRMTEKAYQALYKSSMAFGFKKLLLKEQEISDMHKRASDLENENKELERQLNEFIAKREAIERQSAERQKADEKKRTQEIEFFKRINEQLKDQLEEIVSPKK